MIKETNYPARAEKLNWGALLLTPIWAIVHKKYFIAILSLVPFVGLFVSVLALIYGGRWAWDSKPWISEVCFEDNCTYWNIAAIIIYILLFLILLLK
ncbi:hypothetical protein [Helicovermis profundi]|uniref:Uncharacterized protein n=1 Tax=Helicovermis profundi TaxID=3065157 RepID=A0AAU9E559_9FIRM|nr:hypothetical protein HLPR_21520 [Clostridia bacterium S502]